MIGPLGRHDGRSVVFIAGAYLAFGLMWILLSDRAADLVSPTREALASWQTYKGVAFVLLSTLLIAALLAAEAWRRQRIETAWRDVIDLAEEGFWLIDAEGCTRSVNRRMAALLGYRVEDMLGRSPLEFVVEADRAAFERQVGRGRGEGLRHTQAGPREYEVRLRHRDGTAVPFLVHATALRSADGSVTGSFAFMTDLTAIRERERALDLSRYAIDHSYDEIYRIDPAGRIVDANRAACRNLGYDRDALLGLRVADVDPNFPDSAWARHWAEIEQHGGTTFETLHRTREGVDYPVEVTVRHLTYEGEAFAYAIARDIRERKAAEAAAKRAADALRALSRGNSALIHSQDRDSLFAGVCDALAEARGYPLAWVGLAGDNPDPAVTVAAASGTARGYLDEGPVSSAAGDADDGPAARAIRSGEVQVVRVGADGVDESARSAAAQRFGIRALAALPIRVDGRIVGVLSVYDTDPAAFDEAELPLLAELAADLGFGLRTLEIRAERDRQLAQLRLAGTVFDHSAEGIVVTDADRRIETVNRAFTAITGYSAAEAIGRRPEELLQSGEQDAAFYRDMWSRLRREGVWQGEIRNRRRNGEVYPEWLTISTVRDDDGALTHYVAVFADLTEAHEAREALTFRTYHDTLTGLPNQLRFDERLQEALDDPACRLAVVLVDLEGFGAINDSFGPAVGDEVLKYVAERLRAELGPDDLVARPGGDEFWLLLSRAAHQAGIEPRVEHLRRVLAEPMPVADQQLRLKAAVGIARAPEDGTSREVLLGNAATALHSAQERGSALHFFEPAMHAAVQRRVRVSEALKVALENDELQVWFQPQVDPGGGAVVAAEALVRWQHPQWGWVAPAEFIPVAEASGLVVPIGEFVLECALARMAEWRDAGHPLRCVSVNAAAAQLQTPGWPEQVRAALERHGVAPACLEIELTEQGVLDEIETALATMDRLKALGVRLALDDFGTGYSSLAYLKRLPVDTLKIDKTFVDGLPDEDHGRSIVEAILAVAGALDLAIVAEGVETKAQAEWLAGRGVHCVQGFYFHRPGPPETITGLLGRGG